MSETTKPRFTRSPWDLDDGSRIHLITPAELATLAPGTVLRCIDGTSAVVGEDDIDGDTRYGYLAFGFTDPTPPAAPRPCGCTSAAKRCEHCDKPEAEHYPDRSGHLWCATGPNDRRWFRPRVPDSPPSATSGEPLFCPHGEWMRYVHRCVECNAEVVR